jgi:hypothetical protein
MNDDALEPCYTPHPGKELDLDTIDERDVTASARAGWTNHDRSI